MASGTLFCAFSGLAAGSTFLIALFIDECRALLASRARMFCRLRFSACLLWAIVFGLSETFHPGGYVSVADVDLEDARVKGARLGRFALALGDRAEIVQDLLRAIVDSLDSFEGALVPATREVEVTLLSEALREEELRLALGARIGHGFLQLADRAVRVAAPRELASELQAQGWIPRPQGHAAPGFVDLEGPELGFERPRLSLFSRLAGRGDALLQDLEAQVAREGRELEGVLAVGERALGPFERRFRIVETSVEVGHRHHEVGIGRLRVAHLELRELLAQIRLGEVHALRPFERARLALVLDLIAAVLHAFRAGLREGSFGRQVLARLDRLLVARIRLQCAFVVLERLLVISVARAHRSGALEAFGALRRDLGQEFVDGSRAPEESSFFERLAEEQVPVLVERADGEIALERLDGGLVVAGLAQRLRHRERPRAADSAE